jgi:hypothetical protein
MRCWRAIDFIESPPHDLLPLGLAHPNIKAFEWDALRLQYTFIPIGYTNLSTIRRCGRRYVMAQRVIDGLYCRICAWHWHGVIGSGGESDARAPCAQGKVAWRILT